LNGVDDDFGALFATGVDIPVDGGAVGVMAGKVGGTGLLGGLIVVKPEVDGVDEGDVASMSACDVPPFHMDEWILRALDEHDGNRMRWIADGHQSFRHGGGDRGHGRDLVSEVAAETLGEEATVGDSGGVYARGIDGKGALEISDQGAHERDVIGGGKIARIAPMSIDALGIGDDEGAGLGELVESGKAGHVVGVTAAAVEDEDERGRTVFGERVRNVEKITASISTDGDFAFEVIGVGASAALAAGGVSGFEAGLSDGTGCPEEEKIP
jgi:hypothetical protein